MFAEVELSLKVLFVEEVAEDKDASKLKNKDSARSVNLSLWKKKWLIEGTNNIVNRKTQKLKYPKIAKKKLIAKKRVKKKRIIIFNWMGGRGRCKNNQSHREYLKQFSNCTNKIFLSDFLN